MKRLAILLALVCFAVPRAAGAEVFVLAGGGRLEGELVNADESPRKSYVIKTSKGGQVTLDKDQVTEVIKPKPEEVEYERIRPGYPDTVEGQWALAEWCRENDLRQLRKRHLERIIELDPDHVLARRGLGHIQLGGKWTTTEQANRDRGMVKYKGQWMLPQQVELIERQRKEELAEKEWKARLKRWYGWLKTDRAQEAIGEISQIDDPYAIPALEQYLEKEPLDLRRKLFIASLARIGAPRAWQALAAQSLEDVNEEVRLTCLDYLDDEPRPDVVEYYVGQLRSKDNNIVNRAAVGLARMNDTSAIAPLIDALITKHKYKIQIGQPGATSTTFSSDGSLNSFGTNGGPKIITRRVQNPSVLDALVLLTDGVSFEYDIKSWKTWYAAQKRPVNVDARRD